MKFVRVVATSLIAVASSAIVSCGITISSTDATPTQGVATLALAEASTQRSALPPETQTPTQRTEIIASPSAELQSSPTPGVSRECNDDGVPSNSPPNRSLPGALLYFSPEHNSFVVFGAESNSSAQISQRLRSAWRFVGVSPDYQSLAFWLRTDDNQLSRMGILVDGSKYYELDVSQIDPVDVYPELSGSPVRIVDAWWASTRSIGIQYSTMAGDSRAGAVLFVDPTNGSVRTSIQRLVPVAVLSGNVYVSSDESAIAYLSRDKADSRLVWKVISVISGIELLVKKLPEDFLINYDDRGSASWSRSSRRLALIGNMDSGGGAAQTGEAAIAIIDVTSGATDYVNDVWVGPIGKLTWSSEDRWVAFVQYRESPDGLGTSEQILHLADSGSMQVVFSCPLMGSFISSPGGLPVWSPDERYIAYSPVVQPSVNMQIRPILVDLVSGTVGAPIDDGSQLAGWILPKP